MTADLGILPLHAMVRRSPAGQARYLHPAALPQWRALLVLRWQEHRTTISALSSHCDDARRAAAEADDPDACQVALARASAMWHQAVAQWRALGEIEAALSRLDAGRFGWCQRCGAAIAAALLTETPQARCCPACDE